MTTTIQTTRRQLLIGLAATSAAAVTGTQGNAAIAENPTLLRLADKLPGVLARYLAARDKVNNIYQDVQAQWPSAPKEIQVNSNACDYERDISGKAILCPETNMPQRIATPEYFTGMAKQNAKEIERLSKLKRVAARRFAFHQISKTLCLKAAPIAASY